MQNTIVWFLKGLLFKVRQLPEQAKGAGLTLEIKKTTPMFYLFLYKFFILSAFLLIMGLLLGAYGESALVHSGLTSVSSSTLVAGLGAICSLFFCGLLLMLGHRFFSFCRNCISLGKSLELPVLMVLLHQSESEVQNALPFLCIRRNWQGAILEVWDTRG